MHGRKAERNLVGETLRKVREGHGEVLLVTGEAGIGKSAFLAEAANVARAQGFTVIRAAAHELEREIPLCPLLVALGDSGALLADVPAAGMSSQMQAVSLVREHIVDLAAAAPVLVAVDDIQFADSATMLALRLLPRQLSHRRVGWVLARSMKHATCTESLFRLLSSEGGTEVTLDRLSPPVAAELVAELTDGQPDEGLLAFLSAVGGNPMLIREFIAGLREERLLRVSQGRVTLLAERVPGRVQRITLGKMSELRPATQQLLEAAAVLGRSFAVADVAEMLGQSPLAVLPAFHEALAAGFIVVDGDVLSFRDTLTWSAVTEAIPEPVSRALCLQFAEILLKRGSTLPAAEYLLRGAWRGDRRELDMLTKAATELMQPSPRTAADLALRSLELTEAEDSARPQRSLVAARALAAAGRLDESLKVIEAALSHPTTIAQQAEMRCVLAASYTLLGRLERAVTESQWVLARPDVPKDIREEASVLLMRALAGLPARQESEDKARAVLTARRDGSMPDGNPREVTAALGLLARIRWREGQLADGLQLFREAASGEWSTGSGWLCPASAQLDLASTLIDIRELDEASTLIDAPVEDAGLASVAESRARPALLRARLRFISGRLDAAAAGARAMLSGGADAGGSGDVYDGFAKCLLIMTALRRGDLRKAQDWLEQLSDGAPESLPEPLSTWFSVVTALTADAHAGPARAVMSLARVYDSISDFKWLLVADPERAPWLIRLALAAGDRKRAVLVAAEADELGQVNHAFCSVAASGKHAAGLLEQDAGLLEAAVTTQPDEWERASAAEDLAVLLAAKGDNGDGVAFLDQAHEGYLRTGAARDVARVRRRLRALGVTRRHRPEHRERPASGWAGLTRTETGVAELVARGLTNRQIAEQSFVSVNTVAFHLRRIFRKLGVTSRVELAALVLEGRQDPDS